MANKKTETLRTKKNTKNTKKEEKPDISSFFSNLNTLANSKNLSSEQILEVFKSTLISVLKKRYGPNANIDVKIEPDKHIFEILIHFDVVEKVQSPDYQKSLEEAKKIDPSANVGDVVTIREELEHFSRVGVFHILNTLQQRLRELERDLIYQEFKEKKGELITVQCLFSKGNKDVHVSLGKAGSIDAILPKSEQMNKDRYPPGRHIKVVVKDIILKKDKGKDMKPLIILSRSSAEFVQALFKQEVAEIQDGIVEIIKIVREPGFRTKMIVRSNREDVDPVGACVGIRGVRIQAVIREIHNEKIDVIGFSDNLADMISQALNPAKPTEVRVDPHSKEALAVVPEYELNKAIGPNGKNVRLVSLLVGCKINIKTEREFREEMSSPEARAKLEELFRVNEKSEEETIEEEIEETPLSELPGLTRRVIELLETGGIKSIEQLIQYSVDDLQKIPGINKNMAEYIMKIIQENIEIEEEEE